MLKEELIQLVRQTVQQKTETSTLEIKAAHTDCPKKLYDTLSAFSNQSEGGILLFGIDEESGFSPVGVYDGGDLQRKISEQCQQMEPVVRPVFTLATWAGKSFLSAEIPGMDISQRPCYYKGRGRLRGSYVRMGDGDCPMTEYEIYSYEAYRKRYQDDLRPIEGADLSDLENASLRLYLLTLKKDKENLSQFSDGKVQELMGITKNGTPTMTALLLFGLYPQAFFPQLAIHAVVYAGTERGAGTQDGARFLDNKKIEGTIPQMLEKALRFVSANTKTETIIDRTTGLRRDREEYSLVAVREIILNALIHRDYSRYTEGMPIELSIFSDRLEIVNPGGLYGRLSVGRLGHVIPDTRNPRLVNALELLQVTENRHSGIPTIQEEMKKAGLPPALFEDERVQFRVTLKNKRQAPEPQIPIGQKPLTAKEKDLLEFCREPKTRQQITEFLELSSTAYAGTRYIRPLVRKGLLRLSAPDVPGSHMQTYTANLRPQPSES